MKNDEELQHILNGPDYSFCFDCGFSKAIKMDNILEFLSVAWKHYVVYSIYAEISELRNGLLNTLCLKQLVSSSPKVLYQLLIADNLKCIDAECLQDLFVPVFSEQDSNARTIEEAIQHNWCIFLEEVSGW